MTKRLLSVLTFLGVMAGTGSAQSTNNNPAKAPEVFLDNHRPIIKKKDKAPTSRDLAGKVIDSSGQPIEGALVTLTNAKTNEKTTFITKKDGRFSFDDLSLTNDYQLQARFKDTVTELRNISQYDPNTRINRILQFGSAPEASTADAAKKTAPPQQ
jgi:hypothetical protein